MGTDIHPVIEIFHKGKWEPIAKLFWARNYWLFHVLNGPRRAGPADYESTHPNREEAFGGFPERSARWILAHWYGDHSFSFASARELDAMNDEFSKWAYPTEPKERSEDMERAIQILRGLESQGVECRLAWGYDS